jgi:hypothetical protein
MSDHAALHSEMLREGAVHRPDEQMARLDAVIDRLRMLNQSSADLVRAILRMMD